MIDADIIVVGAGPAGLTAALYAARFNRKALVLHDDNARASWVPLSHNVPGYVDGITGPDLLHRMRGHAERYGADIALARIERVERVDDGFDLTDADGRHWHGRSVILATGIELNEIPLPETVHDAAVSAGVLRYCPVCDGHEHRGQRIGVVGCDASGAAEALFLRGFSENVVLLPRRDVELTPEERRDLAAAGVQTIMQPVESYSPQHDAMLVKLAGVEAPLRLDVLYPALGCRPRSTLAAQMDLPLSPIGKLNDQAPFGTDVPGLFGAGDIVEGLDQITVAMGHGAIAATRAHNWLREQDGHTLPAVLGDEALRRR